MAHIALDVDHLYREAYTPWFGKGERIPAKNLKPDDAFFSKENTYHIIFGPNQEKYKKQFEVDFKDKIIFAGSRARNQNYLETGPRNWYFIF